jgi:predicted negative regulator of RcsB-dependent stress response/outer membrane murein-binding lipoprotein Lpp
METTPKKTNQTPIEQYWKVGIFAVIGLLVVGLVITLFISQSSKKEKQAQDQLYAIETLYFKHLDSANPNPMEDPKAPAPIKVDTEKLKSDLQDFISTHKGLVASQIASMYLSDLLIKENKSAEALNILQANKTTDPHLTSLLLIKKIGQIQAQMNQCNEAVTTWDDLLKIKNARFLNDEIKINQSLCFIEQKDFSRAEKILMEVKSENLKYDSLSKDMKKMSEASPETQSAVRNAAQTNREVDKILRLIQFRQQSASAKSGS